MIEAERQIVGAEGPVFEKWAERLIAGVQRRAGVPPSPTA